MVRKSCAPSEMHADRSSVILTRAVGREAGSPGRVGLVLVQFVSGCVQHHQEEKSGPQRHRPPLNTDHHTTERKGTPPALRGINGRSEAPKREQSNTMWHKYTGCRRNVCTPDSSLSLWQMPMSGLRGFIWERCALRVGRLDQSERSIQDRAPAPSTILIDKIS